MISLAVLLLLSVVGFGADDPCGALLCPSDLTVDQAQNLVDLVANARSEHPAAFDAVARIRADLPELDAAKRGRLAVTGPFLVNIGDGAVEAILERIALADPGADDLGPSARDAWKIGLIDALGKLRDERAAAVLEAVCRSPRTDGMTLTAAAAALGRLETDAAATILVELSESAGDRGTAVLAGMGHCRRLSVVRRLAEALPEQTDPVAHRLVARSLATAANGLVWRAGLVQHPDEVDEIRNLASRALFDAYLVRSDRERSDVVTALLVVDDPAVLTMIDSARATAEPELTAAFDELERRLEANPVSRLAVPER
jgi:hypothetical protein